MYAVYTDKLGSDRCKCQTDRLCWRQQKRQTGYAMEATIAQPKFCVCFYKNKTEIVQWRMAGVVQFVVRSAENSNQHAQLRLSALYPLKTTDLCDNTILNL